MFLLAGGGNGMMQVVKGHKFSVTRINSEYLKYSTGTIINNTVLYI